MPSLTLETELATTPKRHRLFKRITTLGRDRDNDIVLPHPSVDDHHAYIAFDGRVYTLSGVTKKNTVLLNGKREKSVALTHHDVVRLGDIELLFTAYEAEDSEEKQESELERRGYEKLVACVEQLMGAGGVTSLLERLMDAVLDVTGGERGFLLLQNETRRLDTLVARHMGGESFTPSEHDVSDSIVRQALAHGPVLVSDAQNDQLFSQAASVVNLKLSSVMCAPLVAREERLGVLYVGNNQVACLFTDKSLRLFTAFSAIAALLIQNASLLDELKDSKRGLQEKLERQRYGSMLGASEAMQDVFRKLERVAPIDIPVLIQGETGCGKELVARALHDHSRRQGGPFVVINCGAIPRELLESELFGHVRGAFTGAVATRPGLFKAANGGTLFLDEIGDLPLDLQVKLLRVLEQRKVTAIGDTKAQDIDIRLVAASNKALDKAVQQGEFREDLFYRLNVITLWLPPLRERGSDVVLLAKYFLTRYGEEYDRKRRGFSVRALDALARHPWPGNVRELENRVRKAVVMAEKSLIEPEDLGLDPQAAWPCKSLAQAREEFQRQYVLEALKRNGGNRTRTAQMLDVDPRTIFRYLERLDDEPDATSVS